MEIVPGGEDSQWRGIPGKVLDLVPGTAHNNGTSYLILCAMSIIGCQRQAKATGWYDFFHVPREQLRYFQLTELSMTNPIDTPWDSAGSDELDLRGSRWFLAGICFVASIGGLLFGFDTAVIAGTFDFVKKQFGLTDLQVGWFGSSALVGCIIGAASAGWAGDRMGRKPVMIVAAIFFFISALFSAISPSFAILIPARIIGGVGVGMASVLAPMYISEFAPPHIRGRLVALYQLSIVLGILCAYFSNYTLLQYSMSQSTDAPTAGLMGWVLVDEVWRGMFGAEMIPAALFLVLLFFVPESPRWLLQRGRDQQARNVLARVSGNRVAEQEVAEIRESLATETGTLRELLAPGLRTALIVGVGLSFFGQLSGVNIVVYYGPSILERAGFEKNSAFLFQVGFGTINLVFTIVAIFIIDRFGRRPLLIGGMAVVTLALAVTGALFLFGGGRVVDPETGVTTLQMSRPVGLAVVLVLSIYMACIALSICAVIWVLTPEIFPNRVRGRAASIATLTNWSTNALSVLWFPPFVAAFSMHSAFFLFSAICLIATGFFWKLVPETRGQSLEEIEKHWR